MAGTLGTRPGQSASSRQPRRGRPCLQESRETRYDTVHGMHQHLYCAHYFVLILCTACAAVCVVKLCVLLKGSHVQLWRLWCDAMLANDH